MINAKIRTDLAVEASVDKSVWLNASLIADCCKKLIFPPSAIKVTTANVIKPSPPICINRAITVSPNVVNAVPVSTTTSPVTVTADVAVKRLSANVIGCVVIPGSRSNNVPMIITAKKLRDNMSGGAAWIL